MICPEPPSTEEPNPPNREATWGSGAGPRGGGTIRTWSLDSLPVGARPRRGLKVGLGHSQVPVPWVTGERTALPPPALSEEHVA